MNIAVIPARGGSKRIPRKNIKSFNGQPIIQYSIQAAIDSELFDHVFVSTDDQEIADVAIAAGADVPFLRSKDLSNDHAGVLPVIQDAIQNLNLQPDFVTCIYATAPLLKKEDLIQGAQLLSKHPDASFIISSIAYDYPVHRSFTQDENQKLSMLYPECYFERSQDLPTVYHDAAMFYTAKTNAWLESDRLYRTDAMLLPIPENRYCDIDTAEDWLRAEFLAEWNQKISRSSSH